jgi:hypothetical protein
MTQTRSADFGSLASFPKYRFLNYNPRNSPNAYNNPAMTPSDGGESTRPPTDATVRFRPALLGWQIAWVVVALLALGADVAGVLPRVRELLVP